MVSQMVQSSVAHLHTASLDCYCYCVDLLRCSSVQGLQILPAFLVAALPLRAPHVQGFAAGCPERRESCLDSGMTRSAQPAHLTL